MASIPAANHRAYPPPSTPWLMTQRWLDVLFAHWPVDPAALRPLVPAPFELDLFEGEAWVAVVPFHMEGIKLRGVLPLPFASKFPELNVRTYVRLGNDAGVYFFSLDAASRAAVAGARTLYRLPYFNARMAWSRDGDWIDYRCERTHRGAPVAAFEGRYRPVGEPLLAVPGSLDHWLTERYRLLTTDRRGRPWVGEIHHAPWPLRRAEATFAESMARASGILLPKDVEPRLLYADALDVLIWPLRRRG